MCCAFAELSVGSDFRGEKYDEIKEKHSGLRDARMGTSQTVSEVKGNILVDIRTRELQYK
jgi:hypothetical protein